MERQTAELQGNVTCWGGGHSRGGVPNPDEVLEGLLREVMPRVVVSVGFFGFFKGRSSQKWERAF